MFWTLRTGGANSAGSEKNSEKLLAIIEVVVMIFITTFIPSLIKRARASGLGVAADSRSETTT